MSTEFGRTIATTEQVEGIRAGVAIVYLSHLLHPLTRSCFEEILRKKQEAWEIFKQTGQIPNDSRLSVRGSLFIKPLSVINQYAGGLKIVDVNYYQKLDRNRVALEDARRAAAHFVIWSVAENLLYGWSGSVGTGRSSIIENSCKALKAEGWTIGKVIADLCQYYSTPRWSFVPSYYLERVNSLEQQDCNDKFRRSPFIDAEIISATKYLSEKS